MLLAFKLILAAVITMSVARYSYKKKLPLLSDTYKDIFAGAGGKPQLGTTTSTCWIRGGICTHIKECPNFIFDVSVSGCTDGFRVCCKNFRQLPPTVGMLRTRDISSSEESTKELEDKIVLMIDKI